MPQKKTAAPTDPAGEVPEIANASARPLEKKTPITATDVSARGAKRRAWRPAGRDAMVDVMRGGMRGGSAGVRREVVSGRRELGGSGFVYCVDVIIEVHWRVEVVK